ncbi:hypothetical protein ONA00_02620 [Mycoplasmopsis cynos]|uniref:hypothetical protein n=1 Tax=Mycoplasmopsis cynos TaxID=171284 RepID=UPI0024CC23CB|nr:hypothetical protein [Mycoplasmopsis cynos]WAM11338.1 hypothetical protein ONA00_02620 [Mycoplasmopsis cynos]
MWYKDEINKKTNFNDIDNLENSFIFGRYADSIRVRAIINSMLYHLQNSSYIKNRHSKELFNKYITFIKSYVESYLLNDDSRNRDKDHGFTLNDFWRSLNLFIHNNNSTNSLNDQNIKDDIRKTFSLVAQVMA